MVAAGAVRSEVVVLAVGDVVGVEEALIASGNGQDSTVPELRIKRSKIAFFFYSSSAIYKTIKTYTNK